MESLEKEILAVLRKQPERNPDGTLWKMHVGPMSYTKAHILEAWSRDKVMRGKIVELILSLKIHLLGRGPEE
ncbi:MAG: hypothetical protein HWN51_05760 [Desulfobacterales bacterium]|nr:hypothetical protein [Desulfobacterales bacterium]